MPEIKFLNSPISILLYTESQAASFQSLFPDYQFINIVEIDFDFLMNTNHPLADKQIIKASDLIAATDANFNNEDIIYGMNITDNISYNLKYPFQYTYTFSKPSTIPFEELAFLRHNNLALSYSLSIKNCSFYAGHYLKMCLMSKQFLMISLLQFVCYSLYCLTAL